MHIEEITKLFRRSTEKRLIIGVVSAILSLLVINDRGFPNVGISFMLLIWLLIVSVNKPKWNKWEYGWAGLIVFFALSLVIWTNPLVKFFNVVASFYLGLVLVFPNLIGDLIYVTLAPFNFVGSWWVTKAVYGKGSEKVKANVSMVIQVMISLLLLVILVPILASVNPIFEDYVSFVLDPIIRFVRDILYINLDLLPVRIIVASIMAMILVKLPWMVRKSFGETAESFSMRLFLPKTVVAIVLVVFMVSQLQLYMADAERLASWGITLSSRTRGVFFQLSFVSIFILAVLYKEKIVVMKDRALSIFLLVLLVFLNLMSCKSVFDYIQAWGLTQMRLWGLVLVVTLFIMIGLAIGFLKGKFERVMLNNLVLIVGGGMLVMVNLLNFDWLIYNWNPSRTGEGVDNFYLSELSSDTGKLREQTLIVYDQVKYDLQNKYNKDMSLVALNQLIGRLKVLRRQYAENIDLRIFNWSDWSAYQSTKDFNLEEMELVLMKSWETVPADNLGR